MEIKNSWLAMEQQKRKATVKKWGKTQVSLLTCILRTCTAVAIFFKFGRQSSLVHIGAHFYGKFVQAKDHRAMNVLNILLSV